jgi:hypothetical protein
MACAFLFLPSISLAEIPHTISYQGILKDSTGAPVEDGIYAIKFAIYNDSSSGLALWETSGFVPIQTHQGLFSHILGSTNTIPDSIAKYENLWLGLTVNLEPEMTPRFPLSSVPFAFAAQYADTATVSLDKTIDAGELVIGTLDTARFSAYGDLLSENKVGPAPDQVAVGDHLHTGQSFPGTMARYENDDSVTVELMPWMGSVTIKSLVIPAGAIGSYFDIAIPIIFEYQTPGANFILEIFANGQLVHSNDQFLSGSGAFNYFIKVIALRIWGTLWMKMNLTAGERIDIDDYNIDPSGGIIVEAKASIIGSESYYYRVHAGNLMVMYDVD